MSAHELHLLSRAKMFNGHQEQYRCFSKTCQTDMTFGIYLPPQVLKGYPAPVLYFLSGLHGDGSELIRQTGIQRFAAQWNIIVVFPDTSPRGSHISDNTDEFIGQGAGFYVDAAEQPWAAHYRMYSHISRELPDWVERHFPATQERSIAGFSMGGHGALQIALKNPSRYAAVSAFAPIVNPGDTPWGQKAFTAYLGDDKHAWRDWDSTALLATARAQHLPIRIDAGDADEFRPREIRCETFVDAARQAGYRVDYYLHPGYDHSYYTIASYIGAHIAFHAEALGLGKP